MIVVIPGTFIRASAVAAAACLCAALASCSNTTPTSPTSVTTLTTIDIVVGTGDTAASGDTLTVDYTGWLFDSTKPEDKGLQFQTSIGGTPLSFTLGSGQVIAGFDQGVTGMKVGGVRRLIIPSSLAYGNTRHGGIPPNTPLVFEIALDSVTAPGS